MVRLKLRSLLQIQQQQAEHCSLCQLTPHNIQYYADAHTRQQALTTSFDLTSYDIRSLDGGMGDSKVALLLTLSPSLPDSS